MLYSSSSSFLPPPKKSSSSIYWVSPLSFPPIISSRSSKSSSTIFFGFLDCFGFALELYFICLLKPPGALLLEDVYSGGFISFPKSFYLGLLNSFISSLIYCLLKSSSSNKLPPFDVSPRPACFSSLLLIPFWLFLLCRPRPWLVWGLLEKLVSYFESSIFILDIGIEVSSSLISLPKFYWLKSYSSSFGAWKLLEDVPKVPDSLFLIFLFPLPEYPGTGSASPNSSVLGWLSINGSLNFADCCFMLPFIPLSRKELSCSKPLLL